MRSTHKRGVFCSMCSNRLCSSSEGTARIFSTARTMRTSNSVSNKAYIGPWYCAKRSAVKPLNGMPGSQMSSKIVGTPAKDKIRCACNTGSPVRRLSNFAISAVARIFCKPRCDGQPALRYFDRPHREPTLKNGIEHVIQHGWPQMYPCLDASLANCQQTIHQWLCAWCLD